MSIVPFETRAKIISQAIQEIEFARNYKQSKVGNWSLNEDLYYGRKTKGVEARANVDLGQMSSFVHTILSKIDNPLVFKFSKKKDSQLDRVKRLNAVRVTDAERDNWDIKDIAGKKQGVIYGRAIYSYYADSENGYKPHLDNVDVYDFLIDPAAGGLDMERANYLGDYGVVLSRDEIKEGVKSKNFLKTESERLLNGPGNNTEVNQEQVNKQSRTYATGIATAEKELQSKDKFKFWRWGTTYGGKRYFLLLCEDGATAIEVCELEEKFASGMWWYWSWAAFIDLTEFWTPSYCDYVREIFMAQAVSINQMLDNGEQITKPQRLVNVTAIENMAELKYRRDGVIKVKGSFDINKAYQTVNVPAIDTPIRVFETLDLIQEKASGVTAAAQGLADNSSGDKVSIYEGNQAAVADRFGLLNKSYSFGYKRFAELYKNGVDEHLIKKTAVDIIGPEGVKVEYVSRRDIFRKNEDFGIIVEASNAELALSEGEKKMKMDFLAAQAVAQPPVQNAKKAYEIAAGIAGFDDETIRQLQDTSEYGNASLMAKAERDIEMILDGEKVEPNQAATTAYKQRIVDFLTNNQESLSMEEFRKIVAYAESLNEIIARNMVRNANEMLFNQQMAQMSQPLPPAEEQPVSPMGAV
jgi:hypothetical protein